ncbi:hypothetical protein BDW22DRAFT_1345656 [Trametopsis cervina]|nr:hypothetical protein BDW22DRAFT_1345656 [Trametopsis cervina]
MLEYLLHIILTNNLFLALAILEPFGLHLLPSFSRVPPCTGTSCERQDWNRALPKHADIIAPELITPPVIQILQKRFNDLTVQDMGVKDKSPITLQPPVIPHIPLAAPILPPLMPEQPTHTPDHDMDPNPNNIPPTPLGQLDDQNIPNNDIDLDTVYCLPSAQPTYPVFLVDKYVKPLDDRLSSGSVTCWNNMKMFLPYYPDTSDDSSPHTDTVMCQQMVVGRDATAPGPDGRPLMLVLQCPPRKSPISIWKDLATQVRAALACRQAVATTEVVENEADWQWNEDSLTTLFGGHIEEASLAQSMIEATVDDDDNDPIEQETVKGTLKHMINDAARSLDVINPVGFSAASENSSLVNKSHPTLMSDSFGIHLMEWDAIISQSWGFLATSGAYSQPHHDAGRFATYVHCKAGAKLWSYLEPRQSVNKPKEAAATYMDIALLHLELHIKFLKKPFISLARMIVYHKLYVPGDKNPDSKIPQTMTKEYKLELTTATYLVQRICKHNRVEIASPLPSSQLEWLAKSEENWMDPGTEYLIVSDIKAMYIAICNDPYNFHVITTQHTLMVNT